MSPDTPLSPDTHHPVVLVTGANGLVGAHTCAHLLELGAEVRALVRRAGTAPSGTTELVGEFTDPEVAQRAVAGADAVVSTVHPMGSDLATQQRIAVQGVPALARAAAAAGVTTFVHVSTAAVYDRSPGGGDVDESSALAGDAGGDYAVTKRDTDLALAGVDGITRVLLRPPAILGASSTSVWNTLQPQAVREHEGARRAVPEQTWSWVHVDDLTRFAAAVAAGQVAAGDDPSRGPVEGGCTPVNVAAGPATWRDYLGTVAEAVGVEPVWADDPAWTGQILAERAQAWGWRPQVDLASGLAELRSGLTR